MVAFPETEKKLFVNFRAIIHNFIAIWPGSRSPAENFNEIKPVKIVDLTLIDLI